MALQFNPYPVGPWELRQQREQRPDFNQTVSQPILQGLGLLQKNQEMEMAQKRQAMLDDYLRQENARKTQQHAYEFGTPIDPNTMVGMPTGNAARSTMMPAGMGQVATQSPLIEQFNKWRAGGYQRDQARPEFMPALGSEERKSIFDRDKPQPTYVIPGVGGVPTPLPAGQKPSGFSQQPIYVIPTYDKEGNVVSTTPLPPGQKPFGGGKPAGGKGAVLSGDVDKTFRLYETARDNLKTALGKTNTGYFAGKLPAITPEQQNADNAVAQMAPVLKQLFRVAGEGVFTDRDQELLLRMVAGRGIDEGAVPDQLNAMDNLIKAKLGLPADYQGTGGVSGGRQEPIVQRNKRTGQTRISYDGGATWQSQ